MSLEWNSRVAHLIHVDSRIACSHKCIAVKDSLLLVTVLHLGNVLTNSISLFLFETARSTVISLLMINMSMVKFCWLMMYGHLTFFDFNISALDGKSGRLLDGEPGQLFNCIVVFVSDRDSSLNWVVENVLVCPQIELLQIFGKMRCSRVMKWEPSWDWAW